MAGGTAKFPLPQGAFHAEHFPGLADAWIYDPAPDAHGRFWSRAPSMARGRWYPTLITMQDGRVLALSGHPSEDDLSGHNNNDLEIFDGGNGTWQNLGASQDIRSLTAGYLYPRLMVGPGGGLFSATPLENASGEPPQLPPRSASWPGSGLTWTRSALPPEPAWGLYGGFTTPAVLLPLVEDEDSAKSFRFRVLFAGDRQPWIADLGTPTAPDPNPRWRAMGPRTLRVNASLVLLPSTEVLLCGGVGNRQDDRTSVLVPEMLVPDGDGWAWDSSPLAPATIVRNYHSTALLMPDGRVFTGGSNIDASPGGRDRRRLEIEIYEPWYVCRPRPRVMAAADSVRSGERLIARVKCTERVARLVLMRCGSATHAFNADQRCVSMIARQNGTSEEYVGIVPPPAVAVPGWYVLHAVTEKGVPSRGRFVRVERPG